MNQESGYELKSERGLPVKRSLGTTLKMIYAPELTKGRLMKSLCIKLLSFVFVLILLPTLAEAAADPFFATPLQVADFTPSGTNTRPFGIAAGDFDGDGIIDLVVGRVSGNVSFLKGHGDGTFDAPVTFAWKQTTFNAWAFAALDVNNDGWLDVVWGANATTTGCTVSPPPVPCTTIVTVNDGEVRAFLGNGNGTFQETTYFVSGVRHNGGVLLARPSNMDAGSLAIGDVDNDSDKDIIDLLACDLDTKQSVGTCTGGCRRRR